DATLGERVKKHLQALKSDAPQRDTDVRLWFQLQTGKADDALRDVRGNRDVAAAGKLVGWCATILGALTEVEALKRYSDQVQKTRDAAATIANYKGSVTLKIIVLPYAEITRLTTGGKEFALKQRATAIMLGQIEISELEVEFTNGQTKRVEKIPASQLKDGKTYQITGRMQDAKLKVLELP